MAVRELVQKHKTLVGVITIVVVLGALLKITYFNHKSDLQATPLSSTVLFYDLESGKLNPGPDTLRPLENVQSNPKVGSVRAYAYSCSGCKDRSEYTIAYLETFTPQAIDNLSDAGLKTYTLMDAEPSSQIATLVGSEGRLVKAPGEGNWSSWTSSEGQSIRSQSTQFTCPDRKPPQLCNN